MKKLERMTEPTELRNQQEDLTDKWKAKATTNPGADIYWPDAVREPVLKRLIKQTQEHCSFCDAFPVQGVSKNEIEHFVPKKRPTGATEDDDFFRSEAYAWRNLFYICSCCNGTQKGTQWNSLLLKPDATAAQDGYDYEFAIYFECDRRTGKLEAWRHASDDDKKRANETIRIYGLNEEKRPRWRREAWHRWRKDGCPTTGLDRRPYRFFLTWEPLARPNA